MLISKDTGKSPIYLSPLLIHQSQKFDAYYYLASQLVGLNPNLKTIKAIGTDGESALYNAVFPHEVHLRCFNHFKRNIDNLYTYLQILFARYFVIYLALDYIMTSNRDLWTLKMRLNFEKSWRF